VQVVAVLLLQHHVADSLDAEEHMMMMMTMLMSWLEDADNLL
jgi:hypothetical protein